MLNANPTRIDFYERYQEIIENYNNGKEYTTMKELFDQLILLLEDLSEEDKRAERENLEEDELTVFDLMNSGKIVTDKEKHKLKVTAKRSLERLKSNEFKVDHWVEKFKHLTQLKKRSTMTCLSLCLIQPTEMAILL
jgi:type I restriction enzyme R subunit